MQDEEWEMKSRSRGGQTREEEEWSVLDKPDHWTNNCWREGERMGRVEGEFGANAAR